MDSRHGLRIDDAMAAAFNFDAVSQTRASAGQNGPKATIKTGLGDFDANCGGLFPGELVVFAGVPTVGKTALASQIATHAATEGTRVFFAEMERAAESTAVLMLAREARVSTHKILSGCLAESDWTALADQANRLSRHDLFICDDTELDFDGLLECAAQHVDECDNSLIVIDGLDYLDFPSRPIDYASAFTALKRLARRLNVPVVVTCSLRGEDMSLSRCGVPCTHLKLIELLGDVVDAADVIGVIDRSLDELEAEMDGAPPLNTAALTLAKHRNGPALTIDLAFVPEHVRFMDLA